MRTRDVSKDALRESTDRRDFLAKTGRFAAVTPPMVLLLLSTSLTSNAIAQSSALHDGGNGNGHGHGGNDNGNNGNHYGRDKNT